MRVMIGAALSLLPSSGRFVKKSGEVFFLNILRSGARIKNAALMPSDAHAMQIAIVTIPGGEARSIYQSVNTFDTFDTVRNSIKISIQLYTVEFLSTIPSYHQSTRLMSMLGQASR